MNINKKQIRIIFILFMVISFVGGLIKVNASIPVANRLGAEEVYAMPITYAKPIAYTYDIAEETIEETIIEEPIQEVIKHYDEQTVEVLTNLLYGEARGVKGDDRKSAVVWCVLNRYDNGNYGKTIIEVATAENQFCGYVEDRVYKDIDSYNHCKEIVIDVLDRYYTEEQIGRTLPKDYLYFVAKNGENVFTKEWKSTNYWNWGLENPYEN